MSLPEFTDIPGLRSWLARERKGGKRIGLVPTMGALHEGHLSLVDHARRHAESRGDEHLRQPAAVRSARGLRPLPARPRSRPRARRSIAECDALFVPTVDVMYPPGAETRVVPGPSAEHWEGAGASGTFRGRAHGRGETVPSRAAGCRGIRAEGHPAGGPDPTAWSGTSIGRSSW